MTPDLDQTFAALADPTRRGVIELLRERPHRAGELADALETSAPAMSRHLRVLRTRGLVDEASSPDDGRTRVYELRREPFAALSGWVHDVESFWTEQLGSFRAHVEGEAKARRRKRSR